MTHNNRGCREAADRGNAPWKGIVPQGWTAAQCLRMAAPITEWTGYPVSDLPVNVSNRSVAGTQVTLAERSPTGRSRMMLRDADGGFQSCETEANMVTGCENPDWYGSRDARGCRFTETGATAKTLMKKIRVIDDKIVIRSTASAVQFIQPAGSDVVCPFTQSSRWRSDFGVAESPQNSIVAHQFDGWIEAGGRVAGGGRVVVRLNHSRRKPKLESRESSQCHPKSGRHGMGH